jgi:hypothetical protein
VGLEDRGLAKPPARTPAEFVSVVGARVPEARSSFEALTRAYEEVRYGNVAVPEGTMSALEDGQEALLEAIRRSRPAEAPDDPGEPAAASP